MKKVQVSAILALALLLALASGATVLAQPGPGMIPPDTASPRAKYQDVGRALADGYEPMGGCVEVPGLGGMGVHYVNFGLMDTVVDQSHPEALLYVPAGDGFELVAFEYFAVYIGQSAPILFGHPMDGPMPGHEEGMPDHYDLHVWLWEHNPDGLFAPFNPNISCP